MTRRSAFLLVLLPVLLWGAPGSADGVDGPSDEPSSDEPSDDSAVASPGVSPLPAGFTPGSTYGWRTSPRTGRRTFHAGLDYLAPRGTEVRAVAQGIVERVVPNSVGRTRFGGYGRAVVVRHPSAQVWTFYAHLDSVAVTEGQELSAGDPIGAVGNSTNRRFHIPTHLHLEVRRAARGGRSPFPAPYRRFNLDPSVWLRSIGVRYGATDHG